MGFMTCGLCGDWRCGGHTTNRKRAHTPERRIRSVQTSRHMTGFGSKGRPTKKGR